MKILAPIETLLIEHSKVSRAWLKRRLIREGLLIDHCYVCGLTEWLGKPIVQRLDHVNGVNDDYRLENLRLLCPNCDSQTPTYCGRNMERRAVVNHCGCGKEIERRSTQCKSCAGKTVYINNFTRVAQLQSTSL
jgi:hypothetical protein